MPALTVGMATYDDFDGVWFTIQALRLYQDLSDVELVVVDNYGCETTRDFVEHWTPARYVRSTDVQGTSAPRDLVFREATGDAVLCCDSHVLFTPGVIGRLKAYYAQHPKSSDLLQGPLVSDDLVTLSTHFRPEWRSQMWGTWDVDPRGVDPEGEPFDIPMQGLGAFSCRREAWLGFNPEFSGFGGEEGYIHEKFRQAGHRTLCLPWLRWNHRFGRPKGPTYRNTYDDRFRNYLIGHSELGLDLAPIVEHFSHTLPDDQLQRVLTAALWPDHVASVAVTDEQDSPDVGGGLEGAYQAAAAQPSDINDHVPTLRALAAQCAHVTEFGTRGGVSTTALASGKPTLVRTYDLVHDPALDRLQTLAGAAGVTLEPCIADVLSVDIEETDLLFIDTLHTAEQLSAELRRHAGRVRRWIAMHDTSTFGERGEDGGPGLLPALRHFLRERPEWVVVTHHTHNNGFTVISRDPADRGADVPLPAPPDGGGDWPGPSASEGELPFLVAICPTYNRRDLVANAVACFVGQDYPAGRRRLLVLDDFGDLGPVEAETWRVVSQAGRHPTLPGKYAALAELAWARWPEADALVIWEDDDVYLPHHLLAHGRALRTAAWSKPATILSTYGGTLHEEAGAGRFFGSLAVRRDLFDAVGGFVQTRRGDFDQQFMARLQAHAGPPADPTAGARPAYVFRWQDLGVVHGQLFMDGPDDESWYDKAGAAAAAVRGPAQDGELTPTFDEQTRQIMADETLTQTGLPW